MASNGQEGNACSSTQGAGAQLLCLIADPFAQQFKATAIWTALGTSLGFMALIMISFCLIRPRNSVVYAPRLKFADDKHAPPHIGKGIFDWISPLFKLKENDLKTKIGLDATIFLRFTTMCRNIFLTVSLVSCGLILPANIISNTKSNGAQQIRAKGFWTLSTPQNTRGNVLWVHVTAAWLINIIVAFYLWRNYVAVVKLRRDYYQSPEYVQALHSRTLIITDVAPMLRTDEGLLRLTDGVEQTTNIPSVAIGRNVKELPDLIEQHSKSVKKLESILAKYLKNPDQLSTNRPMLKPSRNTRRGLGSGRVDAINFLLDRLQSLEMEIDHVRKTIDKRHPLPYGFASYNSIEEAHTVALAAKGKHPHGATIKLAPKPSDIIWKNLALTKKERASRRFLNNFWVAVLTVVWIAPNAMIAVFLSNLSNLAKVWKGFNNSYQNDPKGWAIVQGIASPALTSLIYVLLPIAFRRMSNRAGDLTKSSRERHVATKLYSFFIFNNLVVFSVFSAVWAYVTTIINSSAKQSVWEAIQHGYFFETLLGGLVEITPFWITWLLQRNLGSAADLAQIWQLIWVWFGRTFTSPTPRQQIQLTAPCAFEYAIYHNYFLFYSTVALCFTTLQPLVIPITAFYFALDYWLKKYLLLYVLITKHESGGKSWRMLFNRMVFAVILADLVIAAVLKASGTWTMIAVLAPMPILLIIFKICCARLYDNQMDFYKNNLHANTEHLIESGKAIRRNDRLIAKFRHPAITTKLMSPMVHANAAHVLTHIYHGRDITDPSHIDSSYEMPQDYSPGIVLDTMSQTQPGKSARFHPDTGKHTQSKSSSTGLFEFVPQNKLDFGYYKNRTEFAEEYGGDGELFGRQTDLISERSGTPLSFMTGGRQSPHTFASASPSSSRAASPSAPGTRTRRPSIGPNYLISPNSPHTRNYSGASAATYSYDGAHPSPAAYDPMESSTNLLRSAQAPAVSDGPVEFSATSGPIAAPAYAYDPEGDSHGLLSPGYDSTPAVTPTYPREYFGLDRWRGSTGLGVGGGGGGYMGVPGTGSASEANYSYARGRGRDRTGSGFEEAREGK